MKKTEYSFIFEQKNVIHSVLFGTRKTEYIIFLLSFVFFTFNLVGFHVRSLYKIFLPCRFTELT